MRRLIGIASLAIAGAVIVARCRSVWTGMTRWTTGVSSNGMAYARWGTGPKTLLLMPGGPGNFTPRGMEQLIRLRKFRPFVEDGYTIWAVTRKLGMPPGHSIADMADDYAEFIERELDGKVDIALSVSFGGFIGFYLAQRHPDRFGHIAITMAGPTVSKRGKHIDYSMAERLSQGRVVEASSGMLMDYYPDLNHRLARLGGEVMGRFAFAGMHPEFASDVMVEAEAEVAFDARPILPKIGVPVLLIGGDADFMFPEGYLEETARLIPDCTLRVYEGMDQMQTFADERLCPDVLDFGRSHR